MKKKYDYIVVGAGSAGVRFARLMATKGYKVCILEKSRVGGTCVIRGCVPKKLYVYASNFKDYFFNRFLQFLCSVLKLFRFSCNVSSFF